MSPPPFLESCVKNTGRNPPWLPREHPPQCAKKVGNWGSAESNGRGLPWKAERAATKGPGSGILRLNLLWVLATPSGGYVPGGPLNYMGSELFGYSRFQKKSRGAAGEGDAELRRRRPLGASTISPNRGGAGRQIRWAGGPKGGRHMGVPHLTATGSPGHPLFPHMGVYGQGRL